MKNILIFSIALLLSGPAVAQQTKITIAATSSSLKTEMTAVGKYPGLMDLEAFYFGGNLCVAIGQTGNGVRCICNSSNSFTDLINIDQSGASRAWSKNELVVWLLQHYEVIGYAEVLQGQNVTISFTINGVQRSGTSNNEAEAIASAILSLL